MFLGSDGADVELFPFEGKSRRTDAPRKESLAGAGKRGVIGLRQRGLTAFRRGYIEISFVPRTAKRTLSLFHENGATEEEEREERRKRIAILVGRGGSG